jgi:hypothetical protein
MIGIAITILSIILAPFFVYLLSKIQMLGWLAGLQQHIESERKMNHVEETENK